MKVEMIKHPTDEDWLLCKQCTLNTVGKTSTKLPTDKWKKKLINSEHSPIRTLWFTFKLELPYYSSVHFSRHKFGVEHFVSTQRDDRTNDDTPRAEKPQGQMVTHIIYINAQEFINMAHKRLCSQAEATTRQVMQEMVRLALETNPEFEDMLVPQCEYTNTCREMFPCPRAKKFGIDVDK